MQRANSTFASDLASSLAKTAGLCHGAVAHLLAGGFSPPHRTIRKIQPYIITTCWTRLAVEDSRHLWNLHLEASEHLHVARMPSVGGHNASAMRADVACEGPFGSTRFLRPCKVHRNFRAETLLNPSVGKQRAATRRWSTSIHGQHEPVQRKRVLLPVLQPASPSSYMPQYRFGGNAQKPVFCIQGNT